MDLLRFLRKEVGANSVRVLPALGKVLSRVLFYTADPDVEHRIGQDSRLLLHDLVRDDAATLMDQARYIDPQPDKRLPAYVEGAMSTAEDEWRSVSNWLIRIAAAQWTDPEPIRQVFERLNAQPDHYFRYHDLNQGRNDYWEYFLVPWMRTYGGVAAAMLDPRMRPYAQPLWERFNRWYQTERPWMVRAILGSNVTAVTAGYALHALIGYVLADDAVSRRICADEYFDYLDRVHRFATHFFDEGIPTEGITYGGFALGPICLLGLVQRRLGLSYCTLDLPFLSTYMAYVESSVTAEGLVQTSGDAHPETHRHGTSYLHILAHDGLPGAHRLLKVFRAPNPLGDSLRAY